MQKRKTTSQLKLKEALFELLLEKNYNDITVSDLVKTAGISRSTFYQYYDDKEDLCENVKFVEMEYFATIISAEMLLSKEGVNQALQAVSLEKRHLYAASQMPTFNNNIHAVLEDALSQNQEYLYNLRKNTGLDLPTAQHAYITVITDLITSWIRTDCKEAQTSLTTKILKFSALFLER